MQDILCELHKRNQYGGCKWGLEKVTWYDVTWKPSTEMLVYNQSNMLNTNCENSLVITRKIRKKTLKLKTKYFSNYFCSLHWENSAAHLRYLIVHTSTYSKHCPIIDLLTSKRTLKSKQKISMITLSIVWLIM